MPPKKQTKPNVLVEQTRAVEVKKNEQKTNLEIYFMRFKEAEVYLKLLSVSLLDKIIGVHAEPHMKSVTEKVESELKDFISQRLEELLGMAEKESDVGFSREDMQALKLVASKVINKQPPTIISPVVQEVVAPRQVVQVEETSVIEEPSEEVMPGVTKVVEEGLLRSTSNDPRVAQISGPTDKMKKVKPKGARMAPPNTSNEMMQLAAQQAQQAEARMAAMSGGQSLLSPSGMVDSTALPNFETQDIFR